MEALTRSERTYLLSLALLLPPPLLFAVGVALGIWFDNDRVTFAVVGAPGNDVIRSFLFVLLCPALAALMSLFYLRQHPSVHGLVATISKGVIVFSLLFLALMMGYLLLENFLGA